MTLLEKLHGRLYPSRGVGILARELSTLLPAGAAVLDVGCGDRLLAERMHNINWIVGRSLHFIAQASVVAS
jgi:2-polyprenyl-3-methyl-5-hydroxy-6-metoxy-1,4-benzoquinol methylase